jgi:ElaB/YqjD/DUF883 family membrane-anchored ribosome-binding protein
MEESQTTAGSGELAGLSAQIGQGIEGGRYTWREIQEAVMAKTRATAAETDQFVHENPWKAVCWAGGLGLVLGLLLAPGSDD